MFSPDTLMYKKYERVATIIIGGDSLLDIGCGTGELIERVKDKFGIIFGIDVDNGALRICNKKFSNYKNIKISKQDIVEIGKCPRTRFDYITALDVLEHLDLVSTKKSLSTISNLLKDGGKFIFTGPNWYDKIRIRAGNTWHKHSHSSLGWKKLIESGGFKVIHIETIEFPILHSEFLRKYLHLFGKCVCIVAEKQMI